MSTHQQVPWIRKKWYPGSWLIACCKLAPTLARQMRRHNYVNGRNEYLIATLSESIFPWVYSLQFLFKSTHHSWRYERKCEWVFFSEHSVYYCNIYQTVLIWTTISAADTTTRHLYARFLNWMTEILLLEIYTNIAIIPTAHDACCLSLFSCSPYFVFLHFCIFFTARCTLVQSAVLRSHVVCLSVRNVGAL